MQTYVILRRKAWRTPADLQQSAARSTAVGDTMPDAVRWIRSYVVQEPDGSLATCCIYQARDAAAARHHAQQAGMRADEILPVVDTVVVRPDPGAA